MEVAVHRQGALLVLGAFGKSVVQRKVFTDFVIDDRIELPEYQCAAAKGSFVVVGSLEVCDRSPQGPEFGQVWIDRFDLLEHTQRLRIALGVHEGFGLLHKAWDMARVDAQGLLECIARFRRIGVA